MRHGGKILILHMFTPVARTGLRPNPRNEEEELFTLQSIEKPRGSATYRRPTTDHNIVRYTAGLVLRKKHLNQHFS